MNKELVIATYDRSYNWISNIDKSISIKVYTKNKNTSNKNEIIIKNNVGRDVHTFFYHIVNQYDNLADYTFFSQDYYIDHVSNYIDIINGDVTIWNNNAKQHFEEYWCYQNAPYTNWQWFSSNQFGGTILKSDLNGFPNHPNLNIRGAWEFLFESDPPDVIEFVPGGHFNISRQQLHLRPKIFYEKVLSHLELYYDSPWIIERLEPYIFNSSIKIKI